MDRIAEKIVATGPLITFPYPLICHSSRNCNKSYYLTVHAAKNRFYFASKYCYRCAIALFIFTQISNNESVISVARLGRVGAAHSSGDRSWGHFRTITFGIISYNCHHKHVFFIKTVNTNLVIRIHLIQPDRLICMKMTLFQFLIQFNFALRPND
jgi:hypothetical protein